MEPIKVKIPTHLMWKAFPFKTPYMISFDNVYPRIYVFFAQVKQIN